VADATSDMSLKWRFLRVGISAKVAGKVLTLWDQWAAGGTSVQTISSSFGVDFTNSPTTAATTSFLIGQIRTAVTGRPSLAPGSTVNIPVATLVPAAVAAIDDPGSSDQMNFNIIGDIPGNIAGGIGKDQRPIRSARCHRRRTTLAWSPARWTSPDCRAAVNT
jgi:hypothetical protein